MQRQMDITGGPRGPEALTADRLVPWAKSQLKVAADILDNPGGGLLFATQTVGQVKAALQEFDEDRYRDVVALLDRAEDHGVKREFTASCRLIAEAAASLD
jgi:hypothetical protein